MATLMSAIDPASHVPERAAKPLETLRIPFAIPVYKWWLRLDMSSHEALFQETGHHDNWNHAEGWFVGGVVPMYQSFTSNVVGDAHPMALKGHDTGPLVPHAALTKPLNMLTPMHILSSSCKWPVSAQRRLHRGKSLCAFAWILAPYLYCSSSEKKQEADDEPKLKPSGIGAKAKSKALATGKAMKGNGVGIALLPAGGKTVFLPLSILDVMLGAMDFAIGKAISKAFDKIWMIRGRDAKRHVRPFTKGAARKAGWPDATRYVGDRMVNKAWKDAAKGFATKAEIGLPFKLVSYSFDTGKIKVWTFAVGGWAEAQRGKLEERSPTSPSPSATGSSASTDELVCWPDQDHASPKAPPQAEPAKTSTPPSAPAEPPPRDSIQGQWFEPEQQEELLGPYDPSRAALDELFEGVPHAW